MSVLEQALPLLIAQSDEQVVSESTGTGDWILAAVILVGSVILVVVTKRLVARAVEGAGMEEPVDRTIGRWAEYLVVIAGIVAFLIILGVKLGPLLTAFAAIGVAVTFAIQDDLRNMWSGMQIQTRRPYSLGDQISTGEWTGTVEAIKLRSTTLRTPSGQEVVVPNANIMLRGIDNLTAEPVRRTTLRVSVAYETDLERAQRLLVDAVRGVEEVDSSKDPEALVGPTGVTFAVRFWHGPLTEDMWSARSASAIAIKSALEEAGVQAPTPHQTVWIQQGSGHVRSQT